MLFHPDILHDIDLNMKYEYEPREIYDLYVSQWHDE